MPWYLAQSLNSSSLLPWLHQLSSSPECPFPSAVTDREHKPGSPGSPPLLQAPPLSAAPALPAEDPVPSSRKPTGGPRSLSPRGPLGKNTRPPVPGPCGEHPYPSRPPGEPGGQPRRPQVKGGLILLSCHTCPAMPPRGPDLLEDTAHSFAVRSSRSSLKCFSCISLIFTQTLPLKGSQGAESGHHVHKVSGGPRIWIREVWSRGCSLNHPDLILVQPPGS